VSDNRDIVQSEESCDHNPDRRTIAPAAVPHSPAVGEGRLWRGLPGRRYAAARAPGGAQGESGVSAEAQAQFKREALLLARLRHPNLPQVTDYFFEADGRQYLVMDYIPGDNLRQLMARRQGRAACR
jgi:serine/threonine protein kinase